MFTSGAITGVRTWAALHGDDRVHGSCQPQPSEPLWKGDGGIDRDGAVRSADARPGRPGSNTEDAGVKVMVDVSVVPLGVGLSLSPYIAECERIFQDAGLKTALHAYGTNIEGEWDEVFAALRRCHERLHAMGVPRITASLRVGTRTDRAQSIEDKVRSVQQKLDAGTS